eukprot:gene3347-3623_t
MNAGESNGQQQQHHSTADALDALLGAQGEVARFVPEQALYASKVRSGKSTAVGKELDLPQAEPYFCYLVMAMQLAVYAAGTWLAVAQGADSAEQWALALAMQPEAVMEQGELWRLGTCLVLHGGLTHLALDTFFLGWMGPGIEALLGHSVYMYVYLFSGLAGSAAVTLLSDPATPVAGATAATVGLVGAMVGYELRNVEVVKQSLKSRLSKAEDGKQGSSTLRKPWGAFGIVCLVLLLGGVPNNMMDNAAHAGGLLAGLGLGYFMGPSFTVVQEIDIPEGSMSVPDDAVEMVVVLDRRSTLDRVLAGAASLGVLSGVLVLGSVFKHAAGN